MRITAFALLFFAVPALAAETGNFPVFAETPSGDGDPNAISCRAPQPLEPGVMGPRICMHNNVWVRLTMTGQDLSADGTKVFARAATAEPTGAGNPDAVTCRKPVATTASRVRRGPEVCLTNRYWKQLAAEDKRVSSSGKVVSTKIYGAGGTSSNGIPVVAAEISPPL
jgi:hypothetical protein